MSSNTNFTEWTREEKEKFAQKRMAEMKLMNAKLKRRHAEVEFDRMAAEKQNSAITNVPKPVKEKEVKLKIVTYDEGREWDRGKPDKDNWESPQHSAPNYSSRTAYNKRDLEHSSRPSCKCKTENNNAWRRDVSNGQKRRTLDRKDTQDSFHRNKSFDSCTCFSYRYGTKSEGRMKSRKEFRSKQYDNHHDASHKSPEKRMGFGHQTNESHRKPHAYSEEKGKKSDFNRLNRKKKLSSRAHSQSSSRSNSDHVDNGTGMKISTVRVESLWGNDKVSEDRNKQNRTENWVKSVSRRSYSKLDQSSDEDFNKKKVHSKHVSGEIKSADCGSTYNPEKHEKADRGTSILNSERVKGVKSKRSPQSSSKNEHVSKQRRFDRGVREEDESKYPNFQQQSNVKSKDDSWNDSSMGNKNIRNERSLKKSNFVKAKTLNETYDGSWGDVKQDNSGKKPLNDDIWEGYEQSGRKWDLSDVKHDNSEKKNLNDDIWEGYEQSGRKWNLSDEDTSLMKHQSEFSERKKGSNTWNENKMPYKKVDKRRATKNYKTHKVYNNRDSYQKQGVDGDNDYEDPEKLWDKFKQNPVNVENKDSYQKEGVYADNDYEDPEKLWDKFKQNPVNVENKDSYQKEGVYADNDCEDPEKLWDKFKQNPVNVENKDSYQKEGVYADNDYEDPEKLWDKFKQNPVNVENKDPYKNVRVHDDYSDNSWNKIKQNSYSVANSKTKVPEATGAFDSGYDNNPAYLAEKLKASCKISDEMETDDDILLLTVGNSDDESLG